MSLGNRPVLSRDDADFSYTPHGRSNGVTQLSGLDGVYDVPNAHSLGWSFASTDPVRKLGGGMM